MILFPFLSALGGAAGVIIDKIALARKKIPLDVFQTFLFLFLCFFTAIFVPFLGKINFSLAFSNIYLLIFVMMIATAIVWNIFYYKGLQKEKLYEFELIITLTPLMTIFLASLFLPEERNWTIISASIIASLALIFAHIRRNHLVFNQYSLGLIICIFLISLEMIFQKLLLKVYSPISLYFFRTLIIFIFFLIFYRPKISKVSLKGYGLIIASAAAGVMQMVLKFYGFSEFGIVYTTLILTLSPILIYFASFFIFKERLAKRTIVAAIIILACIVWASFK